jgi:hypothetical protein
MRRFASVAIFSVTTFAVVFAGATTDHSVVSVLGQPNDGVGPCSSQCGVGAVGQGGASSDEKAQGSYQIGPGRVPGVNRRAAGTDDSGRLELSGDVEGTLSGTFQADRTGTVTLRGRTTGPEFGECTGSQCSP